MADSNSSRIAIKFGGASSRPKPPSSLGKRHRAQAIPDDSDSDAEDGNEGQHEEITGYGPGGAKNDDHRRKHRRERSSSYEERPRRSTSRSRHTDRNGRREDKHTAHNGAHKESEPVDELESVQYGLTINKKSDRQSNDKRQSDSRRDDDRSDNGRGRKEDSERVPKTADEEAMDALLGDEPKRPRHNSDDPADEYRALPIEDFGASLLRNLGWDGKMKGKSKTVEPRKHGNLTGLGSKNAKEAEDLGAWEQKKPKSRRLDDYQREEDARRRRREERHGETSYKRERERERERDRDRHRERR